VVIEDELKRNEEFSGLRIRINDHENLIAPEREILLSPGNKFQILSIEAKHSRGGYRSLPGLNIYNGMGKEFFNQAKRSTHSSEGWKESSRL
jgi:hypothetical protein